MSNFKAGVLGFPIDHSLSPVLHRAAYESLGLSNWKYSPFAVQADELAGFVNSLDATWAGLSLTMPLKQAAFAVADWVEPTAEVTGAINTLIFNYGAKREVRGYNTDVIGILTALGEAGVNADWVAPRVVAGRQAVVLGGGATAASACAALTKLGFTEIYLVVREPERATQPKKTAEAFGARVIFSPFSDAFKLFNRAAVVVSTLPSGVADPVSEFLFNPQTVGHKTLGVLLDVAYVPRPTKLGSAWVHSGGKYVSGERMLLHQAVAQVELMTGERPKVSEMSKALNLRIH